MEIRPPKNKEELEQCFELRYKILRKPWDQQRGTEKDELEYSSFHIAAFDDGKVVGTARLQKIVPKVARIRYMAVDEGYRNRGIGAKMLNRIEEEAKKWDIEKIKMNARENAVGFYKKHGYVVTGEGKLLFGVIRHFKMEKQI